MPDGAYRIGFRAHHLALARPSEATIALPAAVSVNEITGSDSDVHLDVGPHRLIALGPGIERLDPGTSVTAWLDPVRALAFDPGGIRAEPALARGLRTCMARITPDHRSVACSLLLLIRGQLGRR